MGEGWGSSERVQEVGLSKFVPALGVPSRLVKCTPTISSTLSSGEKNVGVAILNAQSYLFEF